ncbi:hypothetical protein OF83DRAFT_1088836, partial [Amylostereum chailletii]
MPPLTWLSSAPAAPTKPGKYVLRHDTQTALRSVLDETRQRFGQIRVALCKRAQTDGTLDHVIPPDLAMERATNVYGVLITCVTSWAKFMHAYRALQHVLLELTAFFDWSFGCRGLPTYVVVPTSLWQLDNKKSVKMFKHKISSPSPLERQTTPHNLPQWFYPTQTASYTEFERQARGVLARSDVYVPSTCMVQKRVEHEREEAERARLRTKYPMFDGFKAGTLPYWNEELRRLSNMSP